MCNFGEHANRMPGFNLQSSGLNKELSDSYQLDGLEKSLWYKNDYFEFTGYYAPNYPHTFHEDKGFYFEGKVYNLEPETYYKEITEMLDNYQFDEVIDLIKTWDGEFVFMYRDKESKSMYIVNDSWGRLPVYYWQEKNKFIATRNISCITEFVNPKVSRINVAMNLLLGTDLGTNTIWKKVHRLPPRSILHIHANGHVSLYEYFHLETVGGEATMEEKADEIRHLFDLSLKNRLEKLNRPSISLSGGLDSRLIAASAKAQDLEAPYFTYNRTNGADHLDDSSSQAIIERLQLKSHTYFQIQDPIFSDAQELLDIKKGLNFLSMSYILPYYRMHRERGLTTITGDGGGKFFVDLSALKSIRSMRSLLAYILRYNALCSLETAAKLTKISPIELEENLLGHLEQYPFASDADKYVYFLIREAGINWAFEGEDRNRHYCWSTTPFYHPALIELCLSIPQSSKAYGALYHHLYQKYPGNLHEVSNPNWKEVVANQKNVKRIHDRQRLKAFLPQRLLELRGNIPLEAFIFSSELQQLMETYKGDLLQLKAVKSKHRMNFYWQLFTLLELTKSSN